MSFTHKIRQTFNPGEADQVDATVTQTADAEDSRSLSVADGVTDQEVVLAVDVSALKSLYMLSTKDVTVETNSASTPDNVFTLKANVPFIWQAGGPALRDTAGAAVTVDIAKLYVTNASGAAAAIEMRVLQDSTP